MDDARTLPNSGRQRLVALLAICALLTGAPFASHAQVHGYRVGVDADLAGLAVQVALEGRVRTLKTRHAKTAEYISHTQTCEGQPLERRGRQVDVPLGVSCITYRYDLAGAADDNPSRWVRLSSANRLSSSSDWLLLPPLSAETTIEVAFALPPGQRVSAPWKPVGQPNTYRFGQSPRSSDAQIAMGSFIYDEISVAGSTLRVSLLADDGGQSDRAKMLDWLSQSAQNVVSAYGRFPHPNPQIIVVPVRGSRNSPVPFGRVMRDGGEAVQFFADPDRTLADFNADWTATHEFAHLLLPHISDRWVSEGFASYYQNVLMARGGNYTEIRGWEKLHAGIERARNVTPKMSPNDTSGGGRKPRMMVYWVGAAIALLGDVQQRQQSGGRESLEVILKRLQACCLPSDRSWTARELFRKFDELSEHKVWFSLYRKYSSSPGVPDLETVYAQLGIQLAQDGSITLYDAAPQSKLRRQLMGPSASTNAQ